ncbi:MAG: hypothetical protein EB079_05690 [Verrucomicrobia bacterium]|nr:hypothetical protein [Verrucomicrobiota bacterium]
MDAGLLVFIIAAAVVILVLFFQDLFELIIAKKVRGLVIFALILIILIAISSGIQFLSNFKNVIERTGY